MRPRINTDKHIVQQSLFTVASGAITNRSIVIGIEDRTTNSHVRIGAVVTAVYVEMWITSDDTGQGSAIVTLEKLDGGQDLMAAGDSAALDTYTNKKNILHTFMGLIGGNTQFPTAAIKGWFKIPKGKQRFGLNDRLYLNIHGQSNGLQGCGFMLYKEQY